MPDGDMLDWLDRLREICKSRDAGSLVVALEIMIDYTPSTNLLKRVIETRDPYTASLAALARAGVDETRSCESDTNSRKPAPLIYT